VLRLLKGADITVTVLRLLKGADITVTVLRLLKGADNSYCAEVIERC
jgi:hypothetical protein